MWRGGCRLNISVSASFVWRCLPGSALAPFSHPAHRNRTCYCRTYFVQLVFAKEKRGGGPKVKLGAEMVFIPGGTFRMGSDKHYPEEAPVHQVAVDGFWIDRTPVTNAAFRRFVRRHRSRHFCRDPARSKRLSWRPAAHAPRWITGILSRGAGRSKNRSNWWNFYEGADWRHPLGREARSRGSTTIRSCTLPIAMRRPTRTGRARICRPKRNGSSPPRGGRWRGLRLG